MQGVFNRLGCFRLYTFELFQFFLLGFAFNAVSGNRSGYQSFFRNRPATGFADTKNAIIDSFNRVLHFHDKSAFAVADA